MSELDELRKDAERYRWLRDRSPGKGNRWPHISVYPWQDFDGPMPILPIHDAAGYHPERLDQWIDAARAASADAPSCWGLSSFCAEFGHKCRAAGKCVFTPPAQETA